MGWSSTVPAAITGLVSALEGASALAGVSVSDGPRATSDGSYEAITVGYSGEDTDSAVESLNTPEGMATSPDRERYQINCAISVIRGSGDITAARTRAYLLLDGVGGALAANHTLDGAVMTAHIETSGLQQAQTPNGALVSIVFAVAVDAFTNR